MTEYTYKYVAQSSGAYGTDAYNEQTYSCSSSDTLCQSGGPGAPNTGFLASSNPMLIGGVFITVALVVTVAVYVIMKKVNRSKVQK